jgi:hypothetical protein
MSFEIVGVELAARAGLARCLADKDSGASEAIEDILVGARTAPENGAHGLAQLRLLAHRDKDATEVIAEWALVTIGNVLDYRDIELAIRHLAQAAPREK